MTDITKGVLLSKKQEYTEKLRLYRNTILALEGAIEAMDDLLKTLEDASLTAEELREALGAQSIEVIDNAS